VGDHISGLAALAGILGAVMEQRQTGRGRVVEVSLLRTGAYVLGWDLSLQSGLGKVSGAEPRHSIQTPLMNSYRASDGRWFFLTGLEAGRHLDRIYRALGRADLSDDPRFSSASALRKNRTEVIAILDEIIAEEPLETWAERFDREGVWWAPAQRPAEVLVDPQLRLNDGLLEVEDAASGQTHLTVNSPISFSDLSVERAATATPPLLGEHTVEVLAELAQGTVARRPVEP
jgi:crotonobetainyl-CoA:carnitine CoA-transferase CaiB-like acyl-CoA transferase